MDFRTSLESVIIPPSINSIGINPFTGCQNLEIRLLNNNHFKIVNGLLISNKGHLISYLEDSEVVTIPTYVTSIGNRAFSRCKSLKRVNISTSVTSIKNYSFSRCESLESINIPYSVTSIGDYAFYKCNSLKRINIPRATSIGKECFPINCKVTISQ
ncbi:MAG: leucine-rich repeat domain-containing protein [Muribaculaceae bacterium]|nr:leucine-rich repeat domain-containing protein [Muribaculaceae bacterium]